MTTELWIALGGLVATIAGVIITWILAKAALTKRELAYRIRMEPILRSRLPNSASADLHIYYRLEELPEPVLLSVDVTNTGNTAIENPPIEVMARGATYVIPGYFESCPPGYESLWSIDRTDAESCGIRLAHINPGQTARARMLMDEMPPELPELICPMAGLAIRKYNQVKLNKFLEFIIDIVSPSLGRLMRGITD